MEDENLTMIIAKGKNLWPGKDGADINDDCKRIYNYLVGKYLIISSNEKTFNESVDDFYHMAQEEFYETTRELLIPSPQLISDLIDEENINIISLFLRDTENRENEDIINGVIGIYMESVSHNLSYRVIETLNALGLPFRDSDTPLITTPKCRCFYDPYQIRMFGDDIYDRG